MRITSEQKSHIVDAVSRADPAASVYLFGSRTQDVAKGGDIDLLVISQNKMDIMTLIKLRVELAEGLEDFPFDLVVKEDWTDPFTRLIRPQAIRLN